MKFKKSKCRILCMRQGNSGYMYRLRIETLGSSPTERDLGVLVDSRLNESAVCPGSQTSQPYPAERQAW